MRDPDTPPYDDKFLQGVRWLGNKLEQLVYVLGILGILLLALFFLAFFWDAAFYLIAGWGFFLVRVLSQVTVDTSGVLTGAVGATGFVVGLHYFLRWLSRETARPWKMRWTFGMAALVLLMFTAGIATVGSVHQVGWLVTSPEPLYMQGSIREAAARTISSNHLRQMALGLLNFGEAHQNQLPPGYTSDRFGQPLHGWQAAILPYIEQEALHKKVQFHVPWDAPENRPAMRSEVKVFLYSYPPLPEAEGGYALSHYAGNSRVLTPQTGLRYPRDFPDGTANTLLLAEVVTGFRPWGHPLNLRDPAKGIRAAADTFAGPRKDITVIALADGSVRPIRNDISPAVLKALATPAGGEDLSGVDW